MRQGTSRRFSGDVTINLVFSLIPIAVTLVSVPLYLDQIGLERYGILTLVWVLTGMLAVFDFGMGTATNYFVARARGTAEAPAAGTVVLTTGAINLCLGSLLALGFWTVLGPVVLGNIATSPELAVETRAAMPWIALLLPVGLVTSICLNAMEGQRRFLAANTIRTGGQVATVLGALIISIVVGPELQHLVISTLVMRVAVLALFAMGIVNLLRGGRLMSRQEFRETIKFGGWIALFNSLSAMLSSADRFVIGWIAGAGATALYAIPLSFTSRLRFVPEAVMRALYPKLAEVETEDKRLELGIRAFTGTLAAMSVITIPAILFVGPFFAVWLGPDFVTTAGSIAQVLLVAMFIQSGLRTLFVLQHASGRPDLPTKLRMVSTLPTVGLVAALTWWFGAIGAALALLITFSCEVAWMLHLSGLLVRMARLIVGFLALCLLAIAVSRIGYGLGAGIMLAGSAALGLAALATYLSPDIAQMLLRLKSVVMRRKLGI